MVIKKKTIILIIVIVLVVAAGSILMINLVKKNTWEKQDLLMYSKRSGGGMSGGSNGTILSAYGDKALLTYSSAEWYYQDPTITEYLVNIDVLDEIKKIFIDEGMYNWKGKKFTNLFIADGKSTSYNFNFTDDDLGFSSQIYPEPYSSQLAKLDRIIEKYSVDGEKLPGLVLPEYEDDEQRTLKDPEDGKIKLGVCEYSQNRLTYWVSNGTDAEFSLEGTYTITDEKENIIASNTDALAYPGTCYPECCSEDEIELENRLEPGRYTLKIGDLSCEFEIK